jgi:hypothetical protein
MEARYLLRMGLHRVSLERTSDIPIVLRHLHADAYTRLAVIVWFILPESPRWYAERGRLEQAKKSLIFINGKVVGYDVDHELAVICQEIDEGKKLSDSSKKVTILSTLRGTNLVSGYSTLHIHPALTVSHAS